MSRLLLSIPVLFVARAALAQDPFEIQVYDSDTAPRLETGLELHANYFARRTTSTGSAPALPTDRGLHVTFEPHLGLTDWAEIGGYLQTAVRPDEAYDYAGAKLRLKARVPRRLAGLVGVAVNAEISTLPRAYADSRFGAELRPIVDVRAGRAYLSVNPILSFDLQGSLAGRPQLEPAAKAEAMLLDDRLGVGVEYYASLGPLTAPFPFREQVHRLFGVIDLARVPAGPLLLGVDLGVGRDLQAGGEWVAKSIIGIEPR